MKVLNFNAILLIASIGFLGKICAATVNVTATNKTGQDLFLVITKKNTTGRGPKTLTIADPLLEKSAPTKTIKIDESLLKEPLNFSVLPFDTKYRNGFNPSAKPLTTKSNYKLENAKTITINKGTFGTSLSF